MSLGFYFIYLYIFMLTDITIDDASLSVMMSSVLEPVKQFMQHYLDPIQNFRRRYPYDCNFNFNVVFTHVLMAINPTYPESWFTHFLEFLYFLFYFCLRIEYVVPDLDVGPTTEEEANDHQVQAKRTS